MWHGVGDFKERNMRHDELKGERCVRERVTEVGVETRQEVKYIC